MTLNCLKHRLQETREEITDVADKVEFVDAATPTELADQVSAVDRTRSVRLKSWTRSLPHKRR